jgi:hypothetical protein
MGQLCSLSVPLGFLLRFSQLLLRVSLQQHDCTPGVVYSFQVSVAIYDESASKFSIVSLHYAPVKTICVFSRSAVLQVLMMFYAGPGCLKDGKPHALSADGTSVNLQLHFLSALNNADPNGAHSIILLMDSCLKQPSPTRRNTSFKAMSHSTGAPAGVESEAVAAGQKCGNTASFQATDGSPRVALLKKGNLIIFSHSYETNFDRVEETGRCSGESWTDALVRSMHTEDDLLGILGRAACEMQQTCSVQHQPWSFYKSGVHSSCSLATYGPAVLL